MFGYLPTAAPAAKVDEAAKKMEQVLRIDEGKEVAPNRAAPLGFMQPSVGVTANVPRDAVQDHRTGIGGGTTAAESRKNELPTTFIGETGGLGSQRHVISSLGQEQRDKIQESGESQPIGISAEQNREQIKPASLSVAPFNAVMSTPEKQEKTESEQQTQQESSGQQNQLQLTQERVIPETPSPQMQSV